jgi:hypothetical protein
MFWQLRLLTVPLANRPTEARSTGGGQSAESRCTREGDRYPRVSGDETEEYGSVTKAQIHEQPHSSRSRLSGPGRDYKLRKRDAGKTLLKAMRLKRLNGTVP